MDNLKELNEEIQQELPEMENDLEEMINKLEAAKRKTKVIMAFKKHMEGAKTFDVKTLVQKLSGNAKFERSQEFTPAQYADMLEELASKCTGDEEEAHKKYSGAIEKALSEAVPPFKSNPENATYVDLLKAFKDFN